MILDDESSDDMIEMPGVNNDCGGDVKVYSFDAAKGTCGETCLAASKVGIARTFDSSLQVASSPSQMICDDMGYKKFDQILKITKMFVTTYVDQYRK